MIISFFGHSDYIESPDDEEKILSILCENVGDKRADLYLGNYGKFDRFARVCGEKYKKINPCTTLFFISPYINASYDKTEYDYSIYPELEKVPPRFAISRRNRWIVESSDIIIAYISRSFGGAYQAYRYAKRKKKKIFNIVDKDI